MQEKLKSYLLNDHIFFGLIIVLVGISSFGLGRVSVATVEDNSPKFDALKHTSLELKHNNDTANAPSTVINNVLPANTISATEELVASKSGTKYHLLSCGGAKQIKEENKIFFKSRAAAEAAGYKPAANCPGLQ